MKEFTIQDTAIFNWKAKGKEIGPEIWRELEDDNPDKVNEACSCKSMINSKTLVSFKQQSWTI